MSWLLPPASQFLWLLIVCVLVSVALVVVWGAGVFRCRSLRDPTEAAGSSQMAVHCGSGRDLFHRAPTEPVERLPIPKCAERASTQAAPSSIRSEIRGTFLRHSSQVSMFGEANFSPQRPAPGRDPQISQWICEPSGFLMDCIREELICNANARRRRRDAPFVCTGVKWAKTRLRGEQITERCLCRC